MELLSGIFCTRFLLFNKNILPANQNGRETKYASALDRNLVNLFLELTVLFFIRVNQPSPIHCRRHLYIVLWLFIGRAVDACCDRVSESFGNVIGLRFITFGLFLSTASSQQS